MEKDRSARLIAIVALVLAVTGVSIGFAVLSSTLTISQPEATVKANKDAFKVYFSNSDSEYSYGDVTPTVSPSAEGFTGNTINVGQNSLTLTGVGGTFTEPGQTITYNLGVANIGKLDGYLNSITFKNYGQTSQKTSCTAFSADTESNPISESKLATVCDDIEIKVTVDKTDYTDSNADIDDKPITAESGMQNLVVTITYKGDSEVPDGDFKVVFGDIELGYDTED